MLQKKICILGATGVGKTSLVKQYVESIFSEKYHTSIGVKIDKKIIELEPQVQLMIWDLEGIDKYCGFNPRYLRGASGMIVVTDQTRFSSLAESIEIFALAKNTIDIPAILAVNKTDLPASMNWDNSLLANHANDFDDIHYTSAKTGESVESLFESIAKLVTSS
jgi:small GTP-binding protein